MAPPLNVPVTDKPPALGAELDSAERTYIAMARVQIPDQYCKNALHVGSTDLSRLIRRWLVVYAESGWSRDGRSPQGVRPFGTCSWCAAQVWHRKLIEKGRYGTNGRCPRIPTITG